MGAAHRSPARRDPPDWPGQPLAEQEYSEVRERYTFLRRSSRTWPTPSRSLQQVIAELDQAMEERFRKLLRRSTASSRAILPAPLAAARLHCGLVQMEESDDGLASDGGRDRRSPARESRHNLALLRGGDGRSLRRRCSLQFLKVNPRPFCLLDEVDAMLGRGQRGPLSRVPGGTVRPYPVYRHHPHRGTVQAANTLYVSRWRTTDPRASCRCGWKKYSSRACSDSRRGYRWTQLGQNSSLILW